jgi:glycosyltransferase involved in cell wall biosynthesis
VNYSVIIPVYNRELLIREALDSVLAQSLPPSEIIVADDGSTDNTLSVVRSLLEERGGTIPWRILELSHSGMAGAVRNRGVEVSKADWIAFLDSDDLWEPEKMTCQDDYSKKNPHCRLIHSREKWLRGSKTISQKKQKHKREGDIFDDALVKCIIGPSTTVIRRELWNEAKGFREDLEIAEDYELWLRITACEMVGYVDSPLITKRAGEWENLSDKYGQIEKFRLHALEQLLITDWFRLNCQDQSRHDKALGEYRRKCEIYARGCEKRGRPQEAREWLKKAHGEVPLRNNASGDI